MENGTSDAGYTAYMTRMHMWPASVLVPSSSGCDRRKFFMGIPLLHVYFIVIFHSSKVCVAIVHVLAVSSPAHVPNGGLSISGRGWSARMVGATVSS